MTERKKIYLLHGWGMPSVVMQPLLPALEADYAPRLVDLPGYNGANDARDFDSGVEQLAETIESGTLLGWSMGGLYAIALAARYPDRFERLVLVACNPCFVQRDDWSCAVEAAVFDQFAADLETGWWRTIKRFLALQMHGVADGRAQLRSLGETLQDAPTPSLSLLNKGLDLLKSYDARPLLDKLELPVHCILGERDALVPATLADEMSRRWPGFRVECLPRAAHLPFLSHSESFLQALRDAG